MLAKQNSQKTLAYRNATFCADAHAGNELPLRIRVTPRENYYLSRYEWVIAATGAGESFLPVAKA